MNPHESALSSGHNTLERIQTLRLTVQVEPNLSKSSWNSSCLSIEGTLSFIIALAVSVWFLSFLLYDDWIP